MTFHEYLPICPNHGQMVKTGRTRSATRRRPPPATPASRSAAPAEFFGREQHLKNHLLLADAFVSPSQFLIDRYVRLGPARGAVPRDRERARTPPPAPPAPLPRGGRRDRFAFFGQITEFKGLHVLLDAVTRVPDERLGRRHAQHLRRQSGIPAGLVPGVNSRRLIERAGPPRPFLRQLPAGGSAAA